MEISSHYYALLALCRTVGLNKDASHKIAYASQFVDDAKINCLDGDDGFNIQNIASCHSYTKIRTFNYEAMINNTVAFHFPPGCEGNTFTEKLICKENSPIIRQIIEEDIESEPEVLGMYMHIYADTFAHQGFSGLLSKENDIEDLKEDNLLLFQNGFWDGVLNSFKKIKILSTFTEEKDFDDFMPAYGHGQANHNPDIPYLKWSYDYTHDRCNEDNREKQIVNNVERFERAFIAIKQYLEMYLRKNLKYADVNFEQTKQADDLVSFFNILKARETTKNKIKSWQKYLVDNKYYDEAADKEVLTYDETLWIKELIVNYDEKSKLHKTRTVKDVKLVEGYEETSWLKFTTASLTYKVRLKELCKENGLTIDQDTIN